ncbi:hypothetical protein NQ176_g10809 [Zarea fungicola]|uniref:Uncharacterized protein n=1 Tax=Zarea fungicola TaxID=93591 RepID=A0ACC1MEH0_9HYPO|nr:hypothetical protein NQ176_g10809 [Lecanicillium fungicola]
MFDDVYVAGLWLRNLASEMMWYRDRLATAAVIDDARDYAPLFKIEQLGQYLAPSFSWAAWGVPIDVNHEKRNIGVLVNPVCIKYRTSASDPIVEWTEDVYGPLSGPVVEVMVVGGLRKMRLLPYYDGTSTDLYVVPDGPSAKLKDMQPWSKDIGKNAREATLDFPVSNNDLEAFVARDDYYFMPWQSHFEQWLPEDPNRPRAETFTSLLLQLEDASMGRFRRIGRMWSHQRPERDLCLAENGNEDVLPCAKYHPDTKQHTIYVV